MESNVTTTQEKTNSSKHDIGVVYHQSRLSRVDQNVSLTPEELLVTYRFDETDGDIDPNNYPTVTELSEIPMASTKKKVVPQIDDADGETVKWVESQHYIRFTSNDLITDIYVPIDARYGSKYTQFIGEQTMGRCGKPFTPTKNTFQYSFPQSVVSKDKVSISQKAVMEKNKTGSILERIFTHQIFTEYIYTSGFMLSIIFAVLISISISVFMLGENNFNFSGVFAGFGVVLTFVFILLGSMGNTYGKQPHQLDYQIERPTNAQTVASSDTIGIENTEIITMTAEIVDGACRLHDVYSDRSWDFVLDGGKMDDELLDFFDMVGAENIEETFSVKKFSIPTENTISPDDDMVFFKPVDE